jgi:hypothetical protein
MDGLNSQNAKRDQHRPIERAKAVLRENPDLKKREVMEKANVGSKVAVNARREIAAEPPPTREEPKRMSPDNDREFAAWLWRKAGREDHPHRPSVPFLAIGDRSLAEIPQLAPSPAPPA